MAIYAPTTTIGNGSHKQVASLVKANEGNASSELSSIEIDGTSYKVKSSGIDSLAGRDGTIPYLGRLESNKDGYVFEEILRRDVFICENEEDYNQSKNSTVTMKQVFDSWIKSGYVNGRWYGYDANYNKKLNTYTEGDKVGTISMWFEWNRKNSRSPTSFEELENATADSMKTWTWPNSAVDRKNNILGDFEASLLGYQYWFYSNKIQSIVQACNTQDTSYYLSPFKMKYYDITVKCKGYTSDDDPIGLIVTSTDYDRIANNFRPYILSFIRTPNNQNGEDIMPIVHCFFKTINAYPHVNNTINSNYWIKELSATFFANRASHQGRFTNLSAVQDTYVPKMNSNGTWSRKSDSQINLYNSNPMPYEKLYKNELYQVNYPLDYNNYLISGGNWSTKTTTIDINNLSAPENWWWMNDDQWNKHKNKCCKTYGWNTAGDSYIRIRREYDRLSAWTTKFTGTPPNNDVNLKGDTNGTGKLPSDKAGSTYTWEQAVKDGDAYMLSIDFNSGNQIDGTNLSKFNLGSNPDGGQIGFITHSQAGATWDIIEMNIPQVFVKTWTNELIEYNPLTKEYKAITDKLPADYCGRGRLCKNLVTGKTFYVGDTHFERVAMIEE